MQVVGGDQQRAGRGEASGRALVLHPVFHGEGEHGDRRPEERLSEAVGLALAIDLDVVESVSEPVTRPRPATLFGEGVLERVEAAVAALEIDLVVVNGALTPVQQRNLERRWNLKVIDRTGLILEIFGERARTAEGQLQVELAHLSYQRSRLVRSWTHLERQRSGGAFMGGPGERQIELDRRQIDDRIVQIKKQLSAVKRTRGLHREARARVPYPVVALVGYTNAGKSTLFNRLTAAEVMARDMLFATLDPTMRLIDLPGGQKAILSDTVGFISNLPTHLVAAFRATLEEVETADLILHVRDISHPESQAQRADVMAVLTDLGIDPDADGRMVEVWNKIDRVPAAEREMLTLRTPAGEARGLAVSALTGEGCDDLKRAVAGILGAGRQDIDLTLDLADGRTLAWLYAHGEVVSRADDDRTTHIRVRLDPADIGRLQRRLREPATFATD
ncbi:MAG: GTPase HflX [Rhodospirillaceae bacterium]|nr:GTPase HflX [Rhodospirillaceae bacterium]